MLNADDYVKERRPRLRAIDLVRSAEPRPDRAERPPDWSERGPDDRLDVILDAFDGLRRSLEDLTPDEAAGVYFDCQDILSDPHRSPELHAYARSWAEIAESVARAVTVTRSAAIALFKAGQALAAKETDERR
jgi:hypothetical protein